MNYFDDYNDNRRSKIPYDEVPITRNERAQRSAGSSGRGGLRFGRFSSVAVSFIVIVNLILSVVCLFLIKNTKNRTINNYSIEVGSSSEVSAVVKNTALTSSVCVSAGSSSGSGVIYKVVTDEDGSNKGIIYFVTCYHVVSNDLKNVKVQLSTNSQKLPVSVLGYSEYKDLAVLKYESDDLEWTLGGCTSATVFNSVYASFGERVFAIGNSLSSGLSITDGLISYINVIVDIEGIESRCLQISAEINPGNSGGGLFNAKGELVGIVNAKRHNISSNGEVFTVVGTSYAIPSSIVRGVAEQIIAGNEDVQKVSIGVEFSNSAESTIEYIDYNGDKRPINTYSVSVTRVNTGVAYGKLRVGDVIESIEFYENGATESKRIRMYNEWIFEDYAMSIKPGSVIKFYIEGREEPIEIVANSSVLVK